MQTKIPLATLREVTTPDGRTVLHGTLGINGARIHIEELSEPTEHGSFVLHLLPPRTDKPRPEKRWPKQEKAPGAECHDADGTLVGFSSWASVATEGGE